MNTHFIKSQFVTKNHSSHYLARYLNFIERCMFANSHADELGYTELHHVLPRAKRLFPEFGNLTENVWNGVRLTPRQHFLAHWMLAKIFTDKFEKLSAVKGFYRMMINSKSNKRYTSKSYSYAKKMHSEIMKHVNPMHDPIIAAKAAIKMKESFTHERRKQISDRLKGKPLCDSAKEKLSKFWSGTERPKTKEHISNHQKSISRGTWVTPFGEFTSPGAAAKSGANENRYSRQIIWKLCLSNSDGFGFISNGRVDNIGRYTRPQTSNSK